MPGWVDQVNSWLWEEESHHLSTAVLGYVKSGPCPRCTHPMKVRRAGPGYFGLAAESAVTPQATPPVQARCNCTAIHPERPEGTHTGCGQAALADGPKTGTAPA